jgi:hypothetical protein
LFFELLHLKEVLVVVISRLILTVNLKKDSMMKTVIAHLFIGSILTFLAPFIVAFVSSVGFDR